MMGDADDAELLAPSTYSRVSRAAYPFPRHRVVETSCGETGGSTGTLRVVYDRQFDRFFLREETSDISVPAKSPKPRRVGSKISTVRKRSSIASVQWEDLILPPRSVAKKNGDIAGKYQGPSDDAASSGKRDTLEVAAEELVEPATVLQSQATQQKSLPTLRTQQQGTTGTLKVSSFTGQGHEVQGSLAPSSNACDHGGGARPPLIDPDSPGLDATQKEVQPTEKVVAGIETPIDSVDSEVIKGVEDSSQLGSKTTITTPLPAEASVSATQANSEDNSVGDPVAVSNCVGSHASETNVTQPQPIDGLVSAREAGTNDSAVSCPVGEKTESSVARAPTPHGSHVVATLSAITAAARVQRVLRRYIRNRRAFLQAPVAPVKFVILPVVPTTLAESAAVPVVPVDQETLVVQDNAPANALQLDLSSLRAHEQSPHKTPTSPHHKSPKKHARVPNYTRHFKEATAAAAAQADQGPSASACLYVDNQNEHDVRWQGDVVHVNIDIATHTNDWESVQSRDPASTQLQQQQRPLLGHVFRLRALARIRPHADGFRRVNESCTFTPLTSSSSESSESDDDPIAVVQVPSSSDDEKDEPVAFKRGDRVLFHARHRWFQGTIHRRIKSSWFYDIRAANGSLFEAVQATRIRRFDGQDDTPVYSFVIGDRVLWRPGDAAHENYRARVVSIRRASYSNGKRYDLELLTGRVVKKVPHDELRPLRSTR